jgi:hypothetical protein
VPDASWFYSSLAQSSAAIVGFLGGFYIYRLLSFMEEWEGRKDRLQSFQQRWASSHHENEAQWDEFTASGHTGPVANFPGWDAEITRRERDDWRQLRTALDEQRLARFPSELNVLALLLLALFLVGTVAPLAALEAPAAGEKAVYVGSVIAIIGATAIYVRVQAGRVFETWKNEKMYQVVRDEYQQQLVFEET